MTFISIIIPFNKEKRYLKDCLDSLANQNLQDAEVILVLNGVKEDIDDLVNEYDLNFIITTFQEEINISKARNEALKIANGEYIYFMDSDDYIYRDGLLKLIDVAKSTKADFINGERINTAFICDRFEEELEKLAEKKRPLLAKDKLGDDEFSFRLLVGDKTNVFEVLSSLHSLIRRQMIRDITFDESTRYQSDYQFMVDVINSVDNAVGVEDAIYAKRIRDDPLNLKSLNQEMGDESFMIYAQNYKKAIETLENNQLKQAMDLKLVKYYYNTFANKFYADPDKRWRNEYFDILADLIKSTDLKKLSWNQKREIKAIKSKDKAKLRNGRVTPYYYQNGQHIAYKDGEVKLSNLIIDSEMEKGNLDSKDLSRQSFEYYDK